MRQIRRSHTLGAMAVVAALLVGLTGLTSQPQPASAQAGNDAYTQEFQLHDCTFTAVGANTYFSLWPGTRYVYEGTDDGADLRLVITVTDQSRQVAGVETRMVEERETEDGELVEISRNYFARCEETNSFFYFGEEVDDYENGEIVGHEGSWLAGQGRNQPGLIMAGLVLLGSRYFQEIAPGVAMDRGEVTSLTQTVRTPAGTFRNVLEVKETTPLEPNVTEFKYYAPGVGLIQDGPVKLVSYREGQGDSNGDADEEEGDADNDDQRRAASGQLTFAAFQGEDVGDDGEFEYHGIVESKPSSGFVGTWVVGGRIVHVTDATEIDEEDGPIGVGVAVEVEGTPRPDGSIDAAEIERDDED